MPSMKPSLRVLLTAFIAAVALIACLAPSAGAAQPLNYVALGDSYSAASGNTPVTGPPECLRSTVNYPHVIAAELGASLSDVTCGGAETADFTTAQYPGVAPQLNAVSADTQLVTMTIGGNDSNVFIDAILDCGTLGITHLGLGSPCANTYGDSFDNTINNTTFPALVAALTAVHAKAPNATVAILGYPWILPASGGCFPQMPVARGDVPYLRNLQATLNSAVQRAAAATGSVYVDFSSVSSGHDACQRQGTRWIEPVIGGTNPVIVHPNKLGESEMAAQTLKVLHLG